VFGAGKGEAEEGEGGEEGGEGAADLGGRLVGVGLVGGEVWRNRE
jgi:hypothetical protein